MVKRIASSLELFLQTPIHVVSDLGKLGMIISIVELVRVDCEVVQLIDVPRIHDQLVPIRSEHALRIREMEAMELGEDGVSP